MEMTDYCFSFFRKPIQNIEPMRAIGIVDAYRYIIGHYANHKPRTFGRCSPLPKPKGTKPPILTIVLFRDYSENGMKRN